MGVTDGADRRVNPMDNYKVAQDMADKFKTRKRFIDFVLTTGTETVRYPKK